ncbi:hypothetical protein SAMD00019534_082340 [Acytostelium subglobosum LB1]|uniref:hypothetical protein n=1 Tax=Acytostelium subglobosum LB1 TaxID=1410327 RepID=UPI000644A3B9|nr:hypothetical protein SAMD00019534_082340 [Acytostelium subglobosum LB1]GAM25059.1 hypothetical protein SAMD00019534_082340 [Acytostelium subglobosum LB1]|eukprot:XP_012752148.1 hypothetical protein SAMD00019534_082340 [Acytostelium subglobosum LB1]
MTFDSHDWENDKDWKQYVGSLHFPGDTNMDQLVFKFKQKYYKNKIDPEYVIREYSSSSSKPQTSSPPPQQSSNHTHARPSSTSSSSSTSQSRSSPPPQQPQQQQQPRQQPQQQQRSMPPQFTRFLYIAWICAQVSVVVFPIMFLFTGNPSFFYRAFLGSIISFAIPLYQTFEGRVTMETLKTVAMTNENAHFLLFGIMMYFIGPPSIMILFPNAIYAVYHLLNVGLPQVRDRVPFLYNKLLLLQQNRQRATEIAIQLEAWIMLTLLFSTIRGEASPLCMIIYYSFLKARYATNALSRMFWSQLGIAVEDLTRKPWMPSMLGGIILKVKAFLSR